MSSDAVTWAKAQRCPSPRGASVLTSLAAYADAEGRAWAAVAILVLETDLGDERTVQRGLADLRKGDPARGIAPLLEDTGDKKLWKGKLIPIYRLPMERGPKNMRERLALERGDLGVTPVSPQAATGDAGVTPTGDTGDGLGVTLVSPDILRDQHNPQVKPQPGAREAVFDRLVKAMPRRSLRFVDLERAWTAFCEVLDEGGDPEELVSAALAMGVHPDYRSRKHPPQLQDWLGKGAWRGWLPEPQLALAEPEPEPGCALPPGAAPEADQAIWAKVLDQMRLLLTEGEFGAWLRPAFLGVRGEQLVVVALTGMARDWLKGRCWPRLLTAWADAGGAGVPLTLVSKAEFEAGMVRRSEGVA